MTEGDKKRKGRPITLNPDRVDKLCSAIREGNVITTACNYAKIPETTFYRWFKWGKEGRRRFVGFMEAVIDALTHGEMRHVNIINKHAVGSISKRDDEGNLVQAEIKSDWKASAWMLERKHPNRWGPRQRIRLDESDSIDPDEGTYEKFLQKIGELDLGHVMEKETNSDRVLDNNDKSLDSSDISNLKNNGDT